mgnify:CR=1 FL=1
MRSLVPTLILGWLLRTWRTREMSRLLSKDVFDFFGHFSLDFVLEGRFSSSLYATFHFWKGSFLNTTFNTSPYFSQKILCHFFHTTPHLMMSTRPRTHKGWWTSPPIQTTSLLGDRVMRWRVHHESFQRTSSHDNNTRTNNSIFYFTSFLWIQLLYLAGYSFHLTYNLSLLRFNTFSTLKNEDSSIVTFCKSLV